MAKIDGVRYLNGRFKKALILEGPDPSLDEYLRQQGIEPDRRETQDEDEVVAILKEGQHDLIYKRSRFIINERVLQASENLAAIMLCCIGDDSVDKQACAREGVLVMNDPISNGWSVVELVFGEMITMARRIYDSVDLSNRHQWSKDNKHRYELRGKTLAIIGLGNIGKQIAQLANAFHMDVCFYDSNEVAREVGQALGWRSLDSIAQAFRVADIVTVHVSAEDVQGNSNELLLNYEEHFSQMGKDRGEDGPRIFVNASRGFVHDPKDLVRAVEEGAIRFAMVDVFPDEPGTKRDPWHNPYADSERIYSTPHIGAATEEAQPRIAKHKATTTRMLNCYGTVRDTVFAPGVSIGVEMEKPKVILAVVHSDARGTKKAVDDCIYEAGLSTLQSRHRDFSRYGIAYDVNALDSPLTEEQLHALVAKARQISGDPTAIRSLRVIEVEQTDCSAE
ncbi:NAD(P)-dependent oxidoreductase [Bradymonas sediminis]|uniref:3-phosphoglycerate dehydrogenase n=1 Tax=Bradymonas sediminis TaxID=1548548 RepID=A0A2Z4FG27_9DELT|nr:NAD(P)-dependent oxidoreductase [Bradymonas sediminis]AWV87849.1 3-phosphoglycerate dehydrogenase [Bradymonas sediminis]TDP73946.1 D-3-phosphoglycerate dehydrogenase [Bradymonas sediminis]